MAPKNVKKHIDQSFSFHVFYELQLHTNIIFQEPRLVETLKNEECRTVLAARDHSMFLMEKYIRSFSSSHFD